MPRRFAARREQTLENLKESHWDLAIIDQADLLTTKTSDNLLLLTATPKAYGHREYRTLLSLLDQDYFDKTPQDAQPNTDGYMPSLRKEDLRTNNGKPLFPEHQFHTVTYSLSPRHQRLCQQIRNVTSSPNTIQAKLENAVTFISPDFYDYDKPDRDPELPHNAEDHKWQSLQLILDDYMKTQKPENEPTKIIIYTNFHSTGDYLKQKLCAYFGNNESVEKVETSEIRNETVGFAASHSSANAISGTL